MCKHPVLPKDATSALLKEVERANTRSLMFFSLLPLLLLQLANCVRPDATRKMFLHNFLRKDISEICSRLILEYFQDIFFDITKLCKTGRYPENVFAQFPWKRYLKDT